MRMSGGRTSIPKTHVKGGENQLGQCCPLI